MTGRCAGGSGCGDTSPFYLCSYLSLKQKEVMLGIQQHHI